MLQKNVSHLQTTFSVSSKTFKKAVDRNRIKRLMKEAWRLQKSALQNELEKKAKYLAVLIIYTGNELPGYDNIFKRMAVTIQHLEKVI